MNSAFYEQLLSWSTALRRKTNLDNAFGKWLLTHYQAPIQTTDLDKWFKQEYAQSMLLQPTSTLEQIKYSLRQLRDRVFYLQYLREASDLAGPMEIGRASCRERGWTAWGGGGGGE